MLFKFPDNLTVNNRDFNSEINTDRDEYTLDPKSFEVINDLFDADILPTLDDWKNKKAVHCLLLEMTADHSKVAHTAISYGDTEAGRQSANETKMEARRLAKLAAKKAGKVPTMIKTPKS